MALATARRVTAARALWNAVRGARRPGAPGVVDLVRAFPRLVAASMSGRYPGLGRGRLAMMLLGIVYVISPVDVMPELLLTVFGLGDDALVVAWLAGTVLLETDAFLEWESSRGRVIPGHVVGSRRR